MARTTKTAFWKCRWNSFRRIFRAKPGSPSMRGEDGQEMPVRVTDVSDTTMTLDANHQLAGEDLVFEVELVAIA
jgi:FKBP-type peptidyl-prolyl cis-trans isomerase 2